VLKKRRRIKPKKKISKNKNVSRFKTILDILEGLNKRNIHCPI
jgi:hypothetical protein